MTTPAQVITNYMTVILDKIDTFKSMKRYMGIYVVDQKVLINARNSNSFSSTDSIGKITYNLQGVIDTTGDIPTQLNTLAA